MKQFWYPLAVIITIQGCATLPQSTHSRELLGDNLMRRPFLLWPQGKPLPTHGYDRAPDVPFDPTSLFITPKEMRPFYGPPGEFGYYIDGVDYGFGALSVIVTETHPGGGLDLHQHDTEEAHILFDGKVTYLIGEKRFTVEGPYVARIPAGVPHTFLNTGARPFHLIGVFPHGRPKYNHIGPNPLLARPVDGSAGPSKSSEP